MRAMFTVCIAALMSLCFTPTASGQVSGSDVYSALEKSSSAPVIVGFRGLLDSSSDLASRAEETARTRARVLSRLSAADFTLTHTWQAISAMGGEVSKSGLAKLLADPDVLGVSLDTGTVASLAYSVPLMHLEDMHAHGYGGAGVIVAVLDTGVDPNHPDLTGSIVVQKCFCTGCCPNGSDSALDDNGHGTHVTGAIVAKGNVAAAGAAPQASVVAIKVENARGEGSDSDVISALAWVILNQHSLAIRVINMSFGGDLYAKPCDNNNMITMSYAQAIDTLKAQGVITFASSGNEKSRSEMTVPACVASAVSVGAVYSRDVGTITFPNVCTDPFTTTDLVTCFTNAPQNLDLVAPGCLITSPRLGGGTTTECGTSEAVPHAAGAAALLLQQDPSLTPDEVEANLKRAGVTVIDPVTGFAFPRVDLAFSPNLVFESSRSGRFQIWKVQTHPLGMAAQVTATGGGNQESRGANWSVAVDQGYFGTLGQPKLGRIVYQFGAPGVRGLHLIKPDGTDDVALKKNLPDEDDRDPSWSPDGRYIVYSSKQPNSSNYGLWIYDTKNTPDDTSDDSQYQLPLDDAGTLDFRPAWSPDFSHIAFVTSGGQVGSHPQIYSVGVIVVNGVVQRVQGPLNNLTRNVFTNFDPSWSPNSQFVAYSSTESGPKQVYIVSSDGLNQRQLTTNSSNNAEPAWSPDGELIAFASDRSGTSQIYVISPLLSEGSQNPAALVSDGTADDEKPAWRVPRRWFTVAVLPTEASLTDSGSQPFTKTVTGNSNTNVTWAVNPVVGTISATGLYNAPTVVQQAQDITITATSVVDQTKFGGATVHLAPSVPTLKGTVTSAVRGGQVITVHLDLKNVGNGAAQAITINSVTLRVLSGTGSLIYASPPLPYVVGDLAKGDSTQVVITLNVSGTVNKFTISESGSLKSANGTQYGFAIAQVAFPR